MERGREGYGRALRYLEAAGQRGPVIAHAWRYDEREIHDRCVRHRLAAAGAAPSGPTARWYCRPLRACATTHLQRRLWVSNRPRGGDRDRTHGRGPGREHGPGSEVHAVCFPLRGEPQKPSTPGKPPVRASGPTGGPWVAEEERFEGEDHAAAHRYPGRRGALRQFVRIMSTTPGRGEQMVVWSLATVAAVLAVGGSLLNLYGRIRS